MYVYYCIYMLTNNWPFYCQISLTVGFPNIPEPAIPTEFSVSFMLLELQHGAGPVLPVSDPYRPVLGESIQRIQ